MSRNINSNSFTNLTSCVMCHVMLYDVMFYPSLDKILSSNIIDESHTCKICFASDAYFFVNTVEGKIGPYPKCWVSLALFLSLWCGTSNENLDIRKDFRRGGIRDHEKKIRRSKLRIGNRTIKLEKHALTGLVAGRGPMHPLFLSLFTRRVKCRAGTFYTSIQSIDFISTSLKL